MSVIDGCAYRLISSSRYVSREVSRPYRNRVLEAVDVVVHQGPTHRLCIVQMVKCTCPASASSHRLLCPIHNTRPASTVSPDYILNSTHTATPESAYPPSVVEQSHPSTGPTISPAPAHTPHVLYQSHPAQASRIARP